MFAASGNTVDFHYDHNKDAHEFEDNSSDPTGDELNMDIDHQQQTVRGGLMQSTIRNVHNVVDAEEKMKQKLQQHSHFFSTILDINTMLKVPAGLDNALKKHVIAAKNVNPDFKTGIPMTLSTSRQQELLSARYLFLPTGQRMMMWDVFVIFAVLYSVFEVPLRIGFDNDAPLNPAEAAWEFTITALFFADVFVTINIPYYDRKLDMLVTNRMSITKKYLMSWFLADLVAAMPFDKMIRASSVISDTQLRSLKLIRIVRLTRLSKLYKLMKFGAIKNFLDKRDISPAFINSLALSFQLMVAAHLIACFWFFITTENVTGAHRPPQNSGLPFEIRTWVTEAGLEYASMSSQYIASLYFTFATLFTVGYGDIHATNSIERFYCIWIEFCSAILFAALIARVRAVVDSQNLNARTLRAEMEDFKAYLEEKDVNMALKTLAKDAYAYYLEKVPNLAEHGFYEDLPNIIKIKFIQHKFMREIRHIHWFRNTDINLIADMIIYMKPQQASVGEYVYGMGDYAEEMGFLMKGNIRLMCLHGTQNEIIGFCSSGGYFGDFEYFHRSPRIAVYQAVQACTLFTIGYNRFDNALANDGDAKVRFMRKLKRRYDNFLEVKVSPLLHGSIDDYIWRGAGTGKSHPVSSGEVKGEVPVEKVLLHDRLWTDGEVEKVFTDAVPLPPLGTMPAAISAVRHSAENALPMMELKMKRTENIYYNMITRKKTRGHDELEELPLEHLTQQWLLFPGGRYKVMWDGFIGMLIFYSILVMPIQMGFADMLWEQELSSTEYVIDVCFFFDMIAAANTAYYSAEDDAYVAVRSTIVYNYATGWFGVDVLSTIPFDLLISAGSTQSNNANTGLIKLVKVLRLLRIIKLVKLFNFTQITNYMEDHFGVPAIVFNLVDMFCRVIFISHMVSCLWWGLTAGAMEGPHWFDEVANTGHALGNSAFQDQYITSLYWVIQTLTTTGYGDVVPVTDNERIVAIVVLVLGATVFSYVVAHISELIQSFNQAEARVAHRMTEVKEFLSDARVSSTLFTEVVDHFKQAMKRNSGFDEHAIIRRLPIRVRDRLMLYHYHELLNVVPIFRYIDNPSVKLYILKNMRQLSVDAGRFIVREDDISNDIIFIYKGAAELKKAVYSTAERRLRERAKFSQLGAALLWCLRAHKAIQMEEIEERMEDERRMHVADLSDFQQRVAEQLAALDEAGADERVEGSVHSPAGAGPVVVTGVGAGAEAEAGTGTGTGTGTGIWTASSSSSGATRATKQPGVGVGAGAGAGAGAKQPGAASQAGESKASDRPSTTAIKPFDKIPSSPSSPQATSHKSAVRLDSDTSSKGMKGSFSGGVGRAEHETPHRTDSRPHSLAQSRRGSFRRSIINSESTNGESSYTLSATNRFRVSARAKIRWEKVKMYLGTIVTMGFQRKAKVYETLGEVGPGEFFGYMECIKKEAYPCSLVAAEMCSYCVLNADVVLRIMREYPAIGIQLQLALGRCIADTSRSSTHQQWQRKNLAFLDEVRKEYTQEINKTVLKEEEKVFRRGSQIVNGLTKISSKFGNRTSAAVHAGDDESKRSAGRSSSVEVTSQKQSNNNGSSTNHTNGDGRGGGRGSDTEQRIYGAALTPASEFKLGARFSRGRIEALSKKVDHLQEFFENSPVAKSHQSHSTLSAQSMKTAATERQKSDHSDWHDSQQSLTGSIHGILGSTSHGSTPHPDPPVKLVKRIKMYRSEADALTATRAAAAQAQAEEEARVAGELTDKPKSVQRARSALGLF